MAIRFRTYDFPPVKGSHWLISCPWGAFSLRTVVFSTLTSLFWTLIWLEELFSCLPRRFFLVLRDCQVIFVLFGSSRDFLSYLKWESWWWWIFWAMMLTENLSTLSLPVLIWGALSTANTVWDLIFRLIDLALLRLVLPSLLTALESRGGLGTLL